MFKKAQRLNSKELGLFFKDKSFFRKGRLVVLRYRKSLKKHPKFAFVVSGPKRSAVARNLARRRIAGIVRSELQNRQKNIDMVFFLKLGQDRKVPKFNELKTDIINVVSSINL